MPSLQSNKKVDDFRKVLTTITKERKEAFNVLWADPKTSPQASHCDPSVHMRHHATFIRKHTMIKRAIPCFSENIPPEDDV